MSILYRQEVWRDEDWLKLADLTLRTEKTVRIWVLFIEIPNFIDKD